MPNQLNRLANVKVTQFKNMQYPVYVWNRSAGRNEENYEN